MEGHGKNKIPISGPHIETHDAPPTIQKTTSTQNLAVLIGAFQEQVPQKPVSSLSHQADQLLVEEPLLQEKLMKKFALCIGAYQEQVPQIPDSFTTSNGKSL